MTERMVEALAALILLLSAQKLADVSPLSVASGGTGFQGRECWRVWVEQSVVRTDPRRCQPTAQQIAQAVDQDRATVVQQP